MKEKETQAVIRNYKDTIFRKLFSDKENLLSLYNLMSSQNYTDPDSITIITLENAIYMNMKNDLAFLVNCTICMYEHQSTLSPNMPLQNLFYVSDEYEKLTNRSTLYSSKQVKLPAPYFVVFYNGMEADWKIRKTRLSEAFEPVQERPNLELIVDEVNINLGINDEMLKKCRPLYEYMQYVEKVRANRKEMPIELAVDYAVKECIQEGILKEFLTKNRSEAIHMSIYEFDEEKEMRLIRADEREIGREEGRKEGERKRILQFIRYDLSQNIAEETITQKLNAIFGLGQSEVVNMMQQAKLG